MIRYFDIGRNDVTELTSWRMKPDPRGVGKREEWYKMPPADLRLTMVPSCWNLELDLFEYTGDVWYGNVFGGGREEEPEIWPEFIGKVEARMEACGVNHKPLVVSEFGVGAIAGDTDPFAPCRWTEEYQEDYYRRAS